MKSEQRQSIRRKIPFEILINHDFSHSQRMKVRDLSLNGVRLERGYEEIPPGTQVEALMTLREHDEYDLHRVAAYVVRSDREGIALQFRNYDDRTYTALVNLLYVS